jgi:glyoxylase-like metal-dependent hydrolase (beta-lactamase superfamily II)
MTVRILATVLLVAAAASTDARQPRPASPRLYVFDNGVLTGLDPKLFGFSREEVKQPDFVAVSYLIVHPRGTVMFDAGAIPDHHFKDGGSPVTEGPVSATRPLRPQLAAAGFRPADVTYLVLSHYHSDHTANAGDFAQSTWIVQRAEREAMFAPKPPAITRPADYAALRTAKVRLLDNEDLDLFDDGTVVVMATPGHTPGHQVLFVRLVKTGPVLLAGDLYHYPEEIATGRVPTFEWNASQSKASRAKVAAFVKKTGAQLWIEHDIATHAKLPRAPRYIE